MAASAVELRHRRKHSKLYHLPLVRCLWSEKLDYDIMSKTLYCVCLVMSLKVAYIPMVRV
jgi:hypothetical protein